MNRTSAHRWVVPAILGAALGFLCAKVVLVGSGLSLVPWALAGLTVGVMSGSRRAALGSGAAYGFALAYVFMVAGYDGDEQLRTRLLPFLVFGIVGALCGAVLALIGFVLSRAWRHTRD